jgi:hypothetical protein
VQTKGQAAVAMKAQEVEPGSFRHRVLTTAQKFKSSWVELGAMLVKVRNTGAWEQWGYSSFESYCSKELRIKKQTALKLTASYGFLARHERAVSEQYERAPLDEAAPEPERPAVPAFEVISVLAGAEERGQLGEKDYAELRESIWADERPAQQVARELSQRFPAPPRPPPPIDLQLRRLAAAARRLASELRACQKVPSAVAERAEALAGDVEELASHRDA